MNVREVVLRLLNKPAFGAAAENLGQVHGHFRRDAALLVHQFRKRGARDASGVADKTGLTAKYDFSVEFDCPCCAGLSALVRANLPLLAGRGGDEAPAPQAATDHPGIDPGSGLPNIFNALEQQLGLKLVKVKDVPVDVVVIDHLGKSANRKLTPSDHFPNVTPTPVVYKTSFVLRPTTGSLR